MTYHLRYIAIYLVSIGILLFPSTRCNASPGDFKGWGIDDPYNRHYQVEKIERFRAWVVGFKTEPPMTGMSPATIMIVRSGSRIIDVHVCPAWFADARDVGVRKGDRVKIRGCRAEIDGKTVFMAQKIKKGNFFEFKVRLTKNGKPFWTLTPEEVAGQWAPPGE